jgi:hypothetical protein
MVLRRDINDKHSALILFKGSMVTNVLMYMLTNYCPRRSLAVEGGDGKNHQLSAAWFSGGALARRRF